MLKIWLKTQYTAWPTDTQRLRRLAAIHRIKFEQKTTTNYQLPFTQVQGDSLD